MKLKKEEQLFCKLLKIQISFSFALLVTFFLSPMHSKAQTCIPPTLNLNNVPALPDVDVTYIERTPKFKIYIGNNPFVNSPWGDGQARVFHQIDGPGLDGDGSDNGWPQPGSIVTYRAHVKNAGNATITNLQYTWYVNGVAQPSYSSTNAAVNLPPAISGGGELVFDFPLAFPAAGVPQTITFTAGLAPGNVSGMVEITNKNNSRTTRARDLTLQFWMDKGMYDRFNVTKNNAGTAFSEDSYSAEDWIQSQYDFMNDRLANSKYPEPVCQGGAPLAPNGALDRVRVDAIIVISDAMGEKPGPVCCNDPQYYTDGVWQATDGDPTNNCGYCGQGPLGACSDTGMQPVYAAAGGFFQWYVNVYTSSTPAPGELYAGINLSTIHESGHQLDLIDEYRLNLPAYGVAQNMGFHVLDMCDVQIPFTNIPPTFSDQLFLHTGRMGGNDTTYNTASNLFYDPSYFDKHSIAGLNSDAFKRRGFFGDFMWDTPQNNYIQIVDSLGNPIVGAGVTLYQKRLDNQDIENVPIYTDITDNSGKIALLPNRAVNSPYGATATGHSLNQNPFGQIFYEGQNGTIFVKVSGCNSESYHWLFISDLNEAYESGCQTTYVKKFVSNVTVCPPVPVASCCQLATAWGTGGTLDLSGLGQGQVNGLVVDASKTYLAMYGVGAGNGGIEIANKNTGCLLNFFATGSNPFGIAEDQSGLLYLAEHDQHRVSVFNPAIGGPAVLTFGSQGTTDGTFTYPRGIWVNPAGTVVFVSDETGRVQRFDKQSGIFVWKATLGSVPGTAFNQFNVPQGIVVFQNVAALGGRDVVYVADTANSRIQKWVETTPGSAMYQPVLTVASGFKGVQMTTDNVGHIYVMGLDGTYRVFNYGDHSSTWGDPAYSCPNAGEFGIAVDSLGDVYGGHDVTKQVKKFLACTFPPPPSVPPPAASCCQLDTAWGSSGVLDLSGLGEGQAMGIAVGPMDTYTAMYGIGAGNGGIEIRNRNTGIVGGFLATGSDPFGIARDQSGLLYLAEHDQHRVSVFNPAIGGPAVLTFGSQGTTDGKFTYPRGIWVNPAGTVVFVSDETGRVQRFDKQSGTFVWKATLGSTSGTAFNQFQIPHGIVVFQNVAALGGRDVVYVADTANSRIQKWVETIPGSAIYQPVLTVASGFQGALMTTDNTGHIFVMGLDGTYRVFNYGNHSSTWGDPAYSCPNTGLFGIAVDDWGRIYGGNNVTQQVKKFLACNFPPPPSVPPPVPSCCQLDTAWGTSGVLDLSGFGEGQAMGIVVGPMDAYTAVSGAGPGGNGGIEIRNRYTGIVGGFLATGSNPFGIAEDQSGLLYVAEHSQHRVSVFNPAIGGPAVLTFGTQGTTNGKFTYPRGIWVNPTGTTVFVSDETGRVQRFDNPGPGFVWKSTLGSTPGTAFNQFQVPQGIVVFPAAVLGRDVVYVADTANSRIQKWVETAPGSAVYQPVLTVASGFQGAQMTTDNAGHIFVMGLDGTYRVFNYGDHSSTWGNPVYSCPNAGSFGIAVDDWGRVYGGNNVNQQVKKFLACAFPPPPSVPPPAASCCQLDTAWGTSGVLDLSGLGEGQVHGIVVGPSDAYIAMKGIGSYTGGVEIRNRNTGLAGGFLATGTTPFGIARDQSGLLYIADHHPHQVSVFNPAIGGPAVMTFGSQGTTDGTFTYPRGIWVKLDGKVVFVSDETGRVQRFDNPGTGFTWTSTLGTSGTAPNQFQNPEGVVVFPAALSGKDVVYVADTSNNRIQRWIETSPGSASYLPDLTVTNATVASGFQGALMTTDYTGHIFVMGLDGTYRVFKYGGHTGSLSLISSCPNTGRIGIAVDDWGMVYGGNDVTKKVTKFLACGAQQMSPMPLSSSLLVEEGSNLQAPTPTNTSEVGNTPTPTITPTASPTPELIKNVVVAPNISHGEPVKFLVPLDKAAEIRLSLFTVTGEGIYQATAQGNAGLNTLTWGLQNQAGSSVASGLYLYLIRTDDGVTTTSHTGKIVVIR